MRLTSHILHAFGMAAMTIVIMAVVVFLIAAAISNALDKQSDLEG